MTGDLTIRDMVLSDIDLVVQIHTKAFPGFFLTRMGPRFLRAYYRAVLEFPHRIALIAEAGGNVNGGGAGFAVGFGDAPAFYADFSRRRRRLLPLMLWAVVRKPSLAVDILRNSRRVEAAGAELDEGVRAHDDAGAVELSSIATLGQGGGVGGVLLAEFAEAATQAGARSLTLTTDAVGNDAVRRFYERRGFVLEGHEMRGSRQLCRYRRSLIAG